MKTLNLNHTAAGYNRQDVNERTRSNRLSVTFSPPPNITANLHRTAYKHEQTFITPPPSPGGAPPQLTHGASQVDGRDLCEEHGRQAGVEAAVDATEEATRDQHLVAARHRREALQHAANDGEQVVEQQAALPAGRRGQGCQMSEVRGQGSEVRGQRSEVRGQKSGVRGQRSESGVRDQRSEVRVTVHGTSVQPWQQWRA